MAVEIAKTHPEGWIVVDAFGRPCCRLREGFFEFHREAKIVVFDSEDECKRFTACVNAQPGNDPALPACQRDASRRKRQYTPRCTVVSSKPRSSTSAPREMSCPRFDGGVKAPVT